MRDRYLLQLRVAYAYLILLYLLLGYWWQWINSEIRAFLLLTALVGIVIQQLAIARSIKAITSNRPFFHFTLLWCFHLAIFLVDESLVFIWGESPLFVSVLSLSLLIIVVMMTAVSFLIRKPFWYAQAGSKLYIIAGCILLVISSWLAFTTAAAVIDYVR